MKIALTNGLETVVDDDVVGRLAEIRLCSITGNYVYSAETGLLHRYIMEATDGLVVDHINGDPLDNRRENLRVCTQKQNCQNRGATRKTGLKGISLHKATNRWRAYIKIDGRQKHLGLFPTMEEASKAYAEAAHKYFGEFANTGSY